MFARVFVCIEPCAWVGFLKAYELPLMAHNAIFDVREVTKIVYFYYRGNENMAPKFGPVSEL